MIDLVCLAADKNIEATMQEILRRPAALGIGDIQFETIVHPHRDPGCFHQAAELLTGYRRRAQHALVVLDRAWDGAPDVSCAEMERQVEDSCRASSPAGWARVVVIEPELEAWVFSDSPHVAEHLGWREGSAHLRSALAARGLWSATDAKPPDPKAAVDWALRRARRPPSSAIYRALAASVSLERCRDRSFLRLKEVLRGWFAGPSVGA